MVGEYRVLAVQADSEQVIEDCKMQQLKCVLGIRRVARTWLDSMNCLSVIGLKYRFKVFLRCFLPNCA